MDLDRPSGTVIDRFGRSAFVDRLTDTLFDKNQRTATGIVLGLTGPWGSGKSQVMIYLEERLRDESKKSPNPAGPVRPLVVVNFNPWLHSGREDLLRRFFQFIHEEIKKASELHTELKGVVGKGEKNEIKKWLARYTGILKAIPMVGAGVADAASAALSGPTLEAEKEAFVASLQAANVSAIVLIDDIDRLSDEEVRGIAQLVKSVANFPMFSYLLAYDPERVAKALGHDDPKLGYQYLEKIVQVQARLPRADPGALTGVIAAQIDQGLGRRADDRSLEGNAWIDGIKSLVPDVIATPRDARRLAAALTLRWPLVKSDVNALDLLDYCALEARVPILTERIQNRVRRITVDGSRELRRRLDPFEPAAESMRAILGDYEADRVLRDLFLHLFPALREDGTEEIARDDDRLCYEASLLTLLNYGPVSGMVTSAEAREALTGAPDAMAGLLTRAADAGRLRHAVLRLRRVYRDLERDGGFDSATAVDTWRRLGSFFDTPLSITDMNKWDSWLDLTHVFVRGALRNYLNRTLITSAFVAKLIDEEQVHLPARILLFHMQAHGLFGFHRDSLLTPTLSAAETHELTVKAGGVAAKRILAGGDRWPFRSVTPLWIVRAADQLGGSSWKAVRESLSAPSSTELLDGLLILAMRHRDEVFDGRTLLADLDVQEI